MAVHTGHRLLFLPGILHRTTLCGGKDVDLLDRAIDNHQFDEGISTGRSTAGSRQHALNPL
jgi:hypothetical protein